MVELLAKNWENLFVFFFCYCVGVGIRQEKREIDKDDT